MRNRFMPSPFLTYTANLQEAGACLSEGNALIFPTETWMALGCKASAAAVIDNILKIKKRPLGKPFPLIASDLEQAARYCDLSKAPERLISTFWPGPLTLILPARRALHPALTGRDGKIAVRISSSPAASYLARTCGEAVIASSANISGMAPAAAAANLDPALLQRISLFKQKAGVVLFQEESRAKKASTIIEALHSSGKWLLRILREGVITEKTLAENNFKVIK